MNKIVKGNLNIMQLKMKPNDMLSIYKCTGSSAMGTLFYFHGGGFVASSASDLPSYQFKAYLALYDVVLIDYPLSPEVPLIRILNETKHAIATLIEDKETTNMNLNKIVFYGRSAGAYMAAYVCGAFIKNNKRVPDQMIMLYGYAYFDDEAFSSPSLYYENRVDLSPNQEKEILSLKKSFSSRFSRTLIYMQARKLGRWFDYLAINKNMLEELDLRNYLSEFPPTFLGYSKHDPDVKPTHSQELEQAIPRTSVFVSDSTEHAFDQVLNDETTLFLQNLMTFLKQ